MSQPINGEKKQYHHPWNCLLGRVLDERYICMKNPGKRYFFGKRKKNYEVCKACKYFKPLYIPERCWYSSTETYETTCIECGAVKTEKKFFCIVKPNCEISENGEQCFNCDCFEWV